MLFCALAVLLPPSPLILRRSFPVLQPIRLLSPNTNTGLLQQLSNLFTSDSGWRVQYTVMDLERIAQEVEFQMKTSGEGTAVSAGSSASYQAVWP